jgi:hypothetical protein
MASITQNAQKVYNFFSTRKTKDPGRNKKAGGPERPPEEKVFF